MEDVSQAALIQPVEANDVLHIRGDKGTRLEFTSARKRWKARVRETQLSLSVRPIMLVNGLCRRTLAVQTGPCRHFPQPVKAIALESLNKLSDLPNNDQTSLDFLPAMSRDISPNRVSCGTGLTQSRVLPKHAQSTIQTDGRSRRPEGPTGVTSWPKSIRSV